MRQPPAPRVSAASSSSLPSDCITGSTSRATKGKVTKAVASTMPGTAKMILMSCSTSQPPSRPRAPNSSTKMRPEITGDTEKGMSMREMSRLLPGKRYLAMSQAAATPNTVLRGTTMAAVSRVSLMAAQVSSCQSLLRYSRHALVEGLGKDRSPAAAPPPG